MTRRQFLIDTIEPLFPLDSKWSDTRQTAKEILHELGVNTSDLKNWRQLPVVTLYQYAEKCAEMEYDSEMLAQWYKDYEATQPMTYNEWYEEHMRQWREKHPHSSTARPGLLSFFYEQYLKDF